MLLWWRGLSGRASVLLLAPDTGFFLPGVLQGLCDATDGYMESLSPGLPLDNSTQPHRCNLRWVCAYSAMAPTLLLCPEMDFGPLGVALTPKPSTKALVQISHRSVCGTRSAVPWHTVAQSVAHLPLLSPLNTCVCLGERACWVCSAFDARVQNYDAAALESCPTSPTSCLQQGSGCFWHLRFSML